ncbi:MAG: ABC transporter substrate-binding protein [Acidimicrobiales bacterium]|jgi:thiamine transport system substrate-binding protein|nr:ABC transporter substrate-binding protein [Acidimicrobiales bacterium]
MLRFAVRPCKIVAALSCLLVLATACASPNKTQQSIRLLTHKDFHLPEEAIADFTKKTGIEVLVFVEEDATSMVNLLERAADNPVADVVLGIDSLERRRVTEKRLVESYRPIAIDRLDPSLVLQDAMLTPISQLAACLNHSKSRYERPERRLDQLPDPKNIPLPAPTRIDDIFDPRYAETAVIPDPLSSRLGVYFLVALERLYPEDVEGVTPWPKLVDEMLRWGVEVAPSWEEAWFSRFQPSAGPENSDTRSLTWGSSGMPAVSVRFVPELPDEVDVAVLDSGCVKVVNYAGVIRNTPNRRDAGRLIDSFVDPLFQYGVPDRYGSRPARTDIVRTEAWRRFGVNVTAIPIDEWRIGPLWEQWLLTWQQIVRVIASGEEPLPPVVEVTLPSQ